MSIAHLWLQAPHSVCSLGWGGGGETGERGAGELEFLIWRSPLSLYAKDNNQPPLSTKQNTSITFILYKIPLSLSSKLLTRHFPFLQKAWASTSKVGLDQVRVEAPGKGLMWPRSWNISTTTVVKMMAQIILVLGFPEWEEDKPEQPSRKQSVKYRVKPCL